MPNPNKGKTTEKINPYYFTIHETKEGKVRFSHTFDSYEDAKTWLNWIKRLPELERRISALEAKS